MDDNAFVSQTQAYKGEIELHARNVIDRARTLGQDGHQKLQELNESFQNFQFGGEAHKQMVESAVGDMSPLNSDDHQFLLQNYLWLSICFLALTISSLIGSIFAPLFRPFFSTMSIFLMLYAFLPVFGYYYQRAKALSPEEKRCFNLLFAMLVGLAMGYMFSNKTLTFWSPPPFIFPLAVALVSGILKLPARQAFLGACGGVGLSIFVFWGLFIGFPLPYLFWALILSTMAVIDIQMKIGRYRSQTYEMGVDQIMSLILFVYLRSFIYLLHGRTKEQAAKAKKKAS